VSRKATNLESYAWAACPACPRILGRMLRPFSLAHALLLERTRNGIWDGRTDSRSDLISAVWICSHEYPHGVMPSSAPRLGLSGRLWTFRAWAGCVISAELQRSARTALVHHIASSLNSRPETYRIEVPGMPDVSDVQDELVPWMITMLLRLVRLGFTHQDALNLPIAQANWLLVCDAAVRGPVRIVSDRERSIFEQNRISKPTNGFPA